MTLAMAVTRRLAEIEAVVGLVPLPLPIDQRDQRNRRIKRRGGDACVAIESFFGTRIKQTKTIHSREALFFVGGSAALRQRSIERMSHASMRERAYWRL